MENRKEMTVPNVSVGADTEQPVSKFTDNSISDYDENIKSFEEMQRELQRSLDPTYLKTVSMNELFDTQYQSKQPLIDSLLYPGTYIFAGAPKLGKSFLMVQIAYHISTGKPLWGFPARKSTVLYLALEDDYRRLQERLYRMFGTDSTENLFFSVSAGQLGKGLDEQLARFVAEHHDTKLIIIETLQKVREVGGDNYSYANDYQIMARLKSFADAHGICLLLVHHTRKQTADDRFDMISGTSGLLGAADGAFLLYKEKRTSNAATLEVSGRDQQDQKLYLLRNMETLLWDFQRAETELWKEPPEPLLDEIAELVMKDLSFWEGSATELVSLLTIEIPINSISKKLNVLSGRLYAEHGIYFKNDRRHDGRMIILWKDKTETV
ncbi:AAA family ATPase [Eubacteriaceae bacterium Marseille-Q4139]|nr:AAA family ATPase [Eubacteriaceae bacterium Marseille-Q4139]